MPLAAQWPKIAREEEESLNVETWFEGNFSWNGADACSKCVNEMLLSPNKRETNRKLSCAPLDVSWAMSPLIREKEEWLTTTRDVFRWNARRLAFELNERKRANEVRSARKSNGLHVWRTMPIDVTLAEWSFAHQC
ncbi:MAG: hypothetical protein ACTS7I_01725 [Candidatus Hodgkinia cicadicola]